MHFALQGGSHVGSADNPCIHFTKGVPSNLYPSSQEMEQDDPKILFEELYLTDPCLGTGISGHCEEM